MRRLAAAAALLFGLTTPLVAQQQAPPPGSFLYGAWVGGIFPPPVTLSARECLSAPMVIFTRDSVLRALMTSPAYEQRTIDSVHATATGLEIRFYPSDNPGLLGFGCRNPDVLPVQRRGDDEIAFPGCTGLPFPLIRCATR